MDGLECEPGSHNQESQKANLSKDNFDLTDREWRDILRVRWQAVWVVQRVPEVNLYEFLIRRFTKKL